MARALNQALIWEVRYHDGVFQQVGITASRSCSYNSTVVLHGLEVMIDAV